MSDSMIMKRAEHLQEEAMPDSCLICWGKPDSDPILCPLCAGKMCVGCFNQWFQKLLGQSTECRVTNYKLVFPFRCLGCQRILHVNGLLKSIELSQLETKKAVLIREKLRWRRAFISLLIMINVIGAYQWYHSSVIRR